jgi:hypothetical protein
MVKKAEVEEPQYDGIPCEVTIGEDTFKLLIVSKKVNVPGFGILTAKELANTPEALLVLIKNECWSIKEI